MSVNSFTLSFKPGITKLVIREGSDFDDSAPSTTQSYATINNTTNLPYLWVEYTEATATTNTTNFFSIL
jgi:hypothetical protein